MKNLIIRKDTGININNFPGECFGYLNNIVEGSEGLLVTTDSGDNMTRIIGIISNDQTMRGLPASTIRNDGFDTTIMRSVIGIEAERVQVAAQVQAHPTAAPQIDVPNVNTQVLAALDAIANRPVVENVNNADENDENQDEESWLHPVNDYRRRVSAPDDSVNLFLAKAMRNNLSSSANMLTSKVVELNRLMSQMIILKNEIELLMLPIETNPKIVDIVNQIKKLNDEDNLIEEAFIDNQGKIVVITDRLSTEILENNKQYDLGKFEICIDPNILLCENRPGSVPSNLILIKNITQYVEHDDSGDWACGHVRHGGEICFGGVFEQLFTALSSKNIVLAIEIIIRFIKNPNLEDAWGCNVKLFPVITTTPGF